MALPTNIINHEDLVIPKEYLPEFIDGVQRESLALRLFRNLGMGSRSALEIPVATELPSASFLDRDAQNGGLKALTKKTWDTASLKYATLAAVIAIRSEDFKDGLISWENVLPDIRKAFGKAIDEAIFFGVNRPKGFPNSLLSSIDTAGALISPSQGETIYSQINRAMAKVEDSGYFVNAIVGGVSLKSTLRNLVDSTGQPLAYSEIVALPRDYANNGAWDATKASLMVGDFSQVGYSIREDITYDVADKGIVQDASGNTINLWQQNFVALKVEMRIGFAVPNPVNFEDSSGSRFPIAAIVGSTGAGDQTVTFTIKDNAETPAVIAGAKVKFANGSIYTTNSSGQVVVKASAGTYPYAVSKKGYNGDAEYLGVATVASSAVTVNVTLPANS